MKKSRYRDSQIMGALKRVDAGLSVPDEVDIEVTLLVRIPYCSIKVVDRQRAAHTFSPYLRRTQTPWIFVSTANCKAQLYST
jgi:hypothetical protein